MHIYAKKKVRKKKKEDKERDPAKENWSLLGNK